MKQQSPRLRGGYPKPMFVLRPSDVFLIVANPERASEAALDGPLFIPTPIGVIGANQSESQTQCLWAFGQYKRRNTLTSDKCNLYFQMCRLLNTNKGLWSHSQRKHTVQPTCSRGIPVSVVQVRGRIILVLKRFSTGIYVNSRILRIAYLLPPYNGWPRASKRLFYLSRRAEQHSALW